MVKVVVPVELTILNMDFLIDIQFCLAVFASNPRRSAIINIEQTESDPQALLWQRRRSSILASFYALAINNTRETDLQGFRSTKTEHEIYRVSRILQISKYPPTDSASLQNSPSNFGPKCYALSLRRISRLCDYKIGQDPLKYESFSSVVFIFTVVFFSIQKGLYSQQYPEMAQHNSAWNQQVQVTSYGFNDAYPIIWIAFESLSLAALLVFLIWSCFTRQPRGDPKRPLPLKALIGSILSYAW